MVKRADLHNVIDPGAVGASAPSGSASALQIAYLPPERLRPRANNARTHSKKQLKQIARSIERFGFVNPVLISDDLRDHRRSRPGRSRKDARLEGGSDGSFVQSLRRPSGAPTS